MNKRRLAGIALSLTGLGVLATAPAAQATGGGHEPVLVCHNRAHNPVLITVDKDSAKYQGHLMHRTQEQNLDLVEGVDGNAASITARCVTEVEVPGPTVTVTGPTVTVTEAGPTVTVTSTDTVTIPGPTVTGPAVTVPGPTTTGEAVLIPGPTTTGDAVLIPGPTTTGPAVTKPGPTLTGAAVTLPGPTKTADAVTVPKAAKPGLIDGPKGSLAFTGPNVGVGALGLLLLGLGVLLTATSRRLRIVRPQA